jgi:hypothetical protein
LRALQSNPTAPVSSLLSKDVIANNPSLYGGGSVSVAEAYRKMGEKMAAGKLFADEVHMARPVAVRPAGVATVDHAAIPAVIPPNVPPSTPKHMPAAQVVNIPERLNSSKQAPINVSVRGEVGQDVGDRTIAHVVTGGLGGKY